jgi:hypothetical protein
VATLCCEAFFLYAYQGYSGFEDRFFNGLAVLLVVIAFFSEFDASCSRSRRSAAILSLRHCDGADVLNRA